MTNYGSVSTAPNVNLWDLTQNTMATSQIRKPSAKRSEKKQVWRPQIATLVMLGVVAIAGAFVIAWFEGQGTIRRIFTQINFLQENPPMWLEVPMVMGQFLLFPTVALFLIVLMVMRVSPQPRSWSRTLVIGILITLTVRYLLWRSLATLNLSTPLNGVFSLGLFLMELMMLSSGMITLFLTLKVRDRRPEADLLSLDVLDQRYCPSVDVMIPTYNEPVFILRRTIIGCQAIDYTRKTIYLLDDTHRPEVESLARELGCEYITRPDNLHAKAGNLNHALPLTSGELIVVFDADFVPTRNFLTRTVGFFQDPQVALLQTPQTFYNPDPIARNLGLEDILIPEEEVFYRHIQPIRDAAGSTVCAGTSFLVRRSALETTGGFVTDSLSEDYFTGIRIAAQGYQVIYLNEKLSAGLAAENIAAHALQRLRWARGTLQAFFIQSNPLTIRGLHPVQRLAHLEGMLQWFNSISRLGLLMMPLAYSFLGVIPLRATAAELVYFFLPYYLVQITVFSWLNYRSRSAILSDLYYLVLCVPVSLTVIQVMLNPFSRGFRVTPKGTQSDRFSFNWNLATPLIGLFIATAISLWINLGMCMIKGAWQQTVPPEVADQVKGIGLGWIWSTYNLVMLGGALLILLDAPRPSMYEWFDLRRTVRLTIGDSAGTPQGDRTYFGVTTMMSEEGAEIALTQAGFPELTEGESLPLTVEILEEKLTLKSQVVRTRFEGDFPTIRIYFEHLTLSQQRTLVEILFCRPGQWVSRQTPGELQSVWLLFRILLKPRVIFDRDVDVSAVAVAKV